MLRSIQIVLESSRALCICLFDTHENLALPRPALPSPAQPWAHCYSLLHKRRQLLEILKKKILAMPRLATPRPAWPSHAAPRRTKNHKKKILAMPSPAQPNLPCLASPRPAGRKIIKRKSSPCPASLPRPRHATPRRASPGVTL